MIRLGRELFLFKRRLQNILDTKIFKSKDFDSKYYSCLPLFLRYIFKDHFYFVCPNLSFKLGSVSKGDRICANQKAKFDLNDFRKIRQ